MPTDDAAILLESVAFEYLHGSAPRISIRATVTKDAGIAGAANPITNPLTLAYCLTYACTCAAVDSVVPVCAVEMTVIACCCKTLDPEVAAHCAVEVNREPYVWSSLEMLEITMDKDWLWEPSWPGRPVDAQVWPGTLT